MPDLWTLMAIHRVGTPNVHTDGCLDFRMYISGTLGLMNEAEIATYLVYGLYVLALGSALRWIWRL